MAPGNVVSAAQAANAGWQLVDTIRQNRLSPQQMAVQIGQAIVGTEVSWGSEWLVADGQPYLLDRVRGAPLPVNLKDGGFRTLLAFRYGLLASEQLTRGVGAFLEAWAAENGRKVAVRQFSHWDEQEGVLYINRFDGSAWRMDGQVVEVVPNGQGALFSGAEGAFCEPNIGPHGELFAAMTGDLAYVEETEGGLGALQQADLYATWLLATAFGSRFPSKPLLLVEGSEGSGKTTAIQRAQLLLTGRHFALSLGQHDEKDFPVQLLHAAPIACLDNQDTPIEWLKDAIAIYTTAGGWRRRVLFTNADKVDIRPETFIAITSRNPSTFRRPDIADRCLLLRLRRRTAFQDPYHMFKRLADQRPRLYGEWLYLVNKCVAGLRQSDGSENAGHRFAGWAQFVHVVAKVLDRSEGHATQLLGLLQAESDTLALEDEPLFPLLHLWLEHAENNGREMKLGQLHETLMLLAAEHHLPFPFVDAKVLSRRLRNLGAVFTRQFDIRFARTKTARLVTLTRKPPSA